MRGPVQRVSPPPRPPGMGGRYSEALDQQAALAAWCLTPEALPFLRLHASPALSPADRDAFAAGLGKLIADSLGEGDAYYWAPTVCETVAQTAPAMPGDWTLTQEAVPSRAGFFWFARPLPLQPYKGDPQALVGLSWYLLYRRRTGSSATPQMAHVIQREGEEPVFSAVLYYAHPARRSGVPALVVPWWLGMSTDDIQLTNFIASGADPADLARIRLALRYVAGSLAFLQQRILVAPHYQADRATRRRHQAWRPDPQVRVVELRRRAELRPADGEAQVAVDWQWQWAVRGHWRQQACGTGQRERRTIWVPSYVKGPADKPLKPPQPTVFVVRR